MADNENPKVGNLFWPGVSTVEDSRAAAAGGATVAALVALITGGISTYSVIAGPFLGYSPWNFIDAGIYAVIAFGIWKMYRTAAVIGFLWYLIDQGYQLYLGNHAGGVVVVFFLIFLFGAIRGTFSYHRLRELELPEAAGHN